MELQILATAIRLRNNGNVMVETRHKINTHHSTVTLLLGVLFVPPCIMMTIYSVKIVRKLFRSVKS